jgi:hypothetical protein
MVSDCEVYYELLQHEDLSGETAVDADVASATPPNTSRLVASLRGCNVESQYFKHRSEGTLW